MSSRIIGRIMMTRKMEEYIRNKAKEYVVPVEEQLCPEEVQFRNIMDKWYSENKDRLENAEFCIHNIELDDKTLRIYKLFQADKLNQTIMKIDCLDKQDLISMARGTSPNYTIMNNSLIKGKGYLKPYGGWEWEDNVFENCTDEEILEVYKLCKNSWKYTHI